MRLSAKRARIAGLALLLAHTFTSVHAAEPEAGTELRIAAVGDVMLGGTAAPELATLGYDHPFALARPILRQSHIVFANLEGPLTRGGEPVRGKQYVFRSRPEKTGPALAAAGFRVVSLANNHTLDYGVEGLRQTIETLDGNGIRHVGAGLNLDGARRPAILEAGGVRVAFLAYSLTFPEEFWASADGPGTAFGHEAHVRADVAQAKRLAELVLVSFHWGQEGSTELRAYQRQLGHAAIDAGAAAVLGHHPHVLQGIERYKHGVILYSLGNFAFGSYSPTATRSAIAELRFRARRLAELKLYPLNVKNAEVVFQPQPLEGRDADEVVTQLQTLSAPLGTRLENRAGVAVLVFDGPGA